MTQKDENNLLHAICKNSNMGVDAILILKSVKILLVEYLLLEDICYLKNHFLSYQDTY